MPSTGDGRKTILITGASSGLGAAIARRLAPGGHRLALVARREGLLADVAEDVRALGGEPLVLAEDLAAPDSPERVVAAVVDRFGGLDVLVNNAGIGLPRYYSECEPEDLREQAAVNFVAPIVLTRHALPFLIASRGSVINIGSAIAAVANPILGAYGAGKAGVAYWNDALRREMRDRGVSVSLVDLGPISTDFFEAVRRRAGRRRTAPPLGVDPAPDALYNAMRDRPPAFMTSNVDDVAQQIVGLLGRPRRRLRTPRRIVWPFRALGTMLQLAPAIADMGVAAMIRRVLREEAREGGPPKPRTPRSPNPPMSDGVECPMKVERGENGLPARSDSIVGP